MLTVASDVKKQITGNEDQHPYSQYLTERHRVLAQALIGTHLSKAAQEHTRLKTHEHTIEGSVSTEDPSVYHASEFIAFANALEDSKQQFNARHKERLTSALERTVESLESAYRQESGG